MSFTNYLEQKLLDGYFGQNVALSPPANLYAALATALPGEAGTFSEVAGSGYARVQVPNNSSYWNAAVAGLKTNAQDIDFPVATGDWNGGASFQHIGFFDAASGGNLLAYGTLTSAQTVLSGQVLSLPAGQVSVTLD